MSSSVQKVACLLIETQAARLMLWIKEASSITPTFGLMFCSFAPLLGTYLMLSSFIFLVAVAYLLTVENPFPWFRRAFHSVLIRLHVVLTMFTGYLVGYAAFRALFGRTPVMSTAGGIIGLVFGMLLETFLFIIRASNYELRSSPSTADVKKNQ